MISIRFDYKKELDSIKREVLEETVNAVHKQAKDALDELRSKTPVDTGRARDSWRLDFTRQGATLSNDTPYLPQLNSGSSQQAPSHFIEAVMLHYGRPRGFIVSY